MKPLALPIAAAAFLTLSACMGKAPETGNDAAATETMAENATIPVEDNVMMDANTMSGIDTNGADANMANAADPDEGDNETSGGNDK